MSEQTRKYLIHDGYLKLSDGGRILKNIICYRDVDRYCDEKCMAFEIKDGEVFCFALDINRKLENE